MENLKLVDLLEEMLFNDRARGLSLKTIKKHRKFLNLFFEFLLDKNIKYFDEVTVIHIREFMIIKLEEKKAESYINSHLRSIRALCKYCVDEGYVQPHKNPCIYVKWMKERKVVINTFTDDEVRRMLIYSKKRTAYQVKRLDKHHTGLQTRFVNERNYLLLLILVDTGMRINEIMNLKHQHINESDIFIENGKGKKDRVIHCSPLVYKSYLKYLRVANNFFEYYDILKDDYVFLTKNGKKYNYVSAEREIKKIGKETNIKSSIRVSPHTFRHYFTQKLVRNGADVYIIQQLLGHASIKTTEIYLRSLNIEKSMDKVRTKSPLQTI